MVKRRLVEKIKEDKKVLTDKKLSV